MRKLGRWLTLIFATMAYSQAVCAQPLTLMTWNMQWLTLSPSVLATPRTLTDYAAMRAVLKRHSPDILAFQEVDSPEALQRVVGPTYQLYFSDRRQAKYAATRQFNGVNQYTGIAVRKGLKVRDPQDVDLLPKQPRSKLRFATYIILHTAKQDIHLLSVHLKAGCVTAYHANSHSCRRLKQQGAALNQWIQQRVLQQQAYIILGDVNHQLAYPTDWLWTRITQDVTPVPILSSRYTMSRCIARSASLPTRTVTYRHLVDHIIHSRDVVMRSAEQQHFTRQDVLKYHLSDHCPVVTRLTGDVSK